MEDLESIREITRVIENKREKSEVNKSGINFLQTDFPKNMGLNKKIRGPEPRPLLQATILFHLRGHLMKS